MFLGIANNGFSAVNIPNTAQIEDVVQDIPQNEVVDCSVMESDNLDSNSADVISFHENRHTSGRKRKRPTKYNDYIL